MYNQKGAISGIRSGFIDLDNKLSGLNNSDLILVAARPAMGKSAFAINIATNASNKIKHTSSNIQFRNVKRTSSKIEYYVVKH